MPAKRVEIDITKKYNKLTPIKFFKLPDEPCGRWLCSCDCGGMKRVRAGDLANGLVKSCGCLVERQDLTGRRFGHLIAVSYLDKKWLCKCDCGNETRVSAGNLIHNSVKSCGCMRLKNLAGKRFGKLLVIEKLPYDGKGKTRYMCKCDCGNDCIMSYHQLIYTKRKSCGCE